MTPKKTDKDKDAAIVQKRPTAALIKVRVKMAHERDRVDRAGNRVGFWRYRAGQEIVIRENEFSENLHERIDLEV